MLRAVAAVTLAALTTSPYTRTEWTTFAPINGGFSVSVPADPQVTVKLIPSASGVLRTNIASSEVTRKSHFTVSWTAYPASRKMPLVSECALDKMVNALVEAQNGAGVVQHDILIGSVTGREVTFGTDQGATIRTRFYIVGRSIYQLTAEWSGDYDGSAEADRFLTSFKVAS